MDTTSTPDAPVAVSIPTIKTIVDNITHSEQCLQADAKMEEYINLIPKIQFATQDDKNAYAADLYTIQEEVRAKFNIIKHEELRQENERFKQLINNWGLPDVNRPQQFQTQSRRKKTTPVKTTAAKKQKTTETDATECTNKFDSLAIEEIPEQIEIDDEDGEHTENYLLCPMNPLNKPKKDNKKNASNEQRIKLKNILKEKREERTTRPNLHTTPTSYAEALKNPVEKNLPVTSPITPTPRSQF
ncbi:hypothetical protein NPIL_12421 [Nephila pilipes]|uniref:Uncharacterized protein n=1 Tax=Nephila pilipes TaxID=299642 RepID=A0A8X6TNB8_NEPPI|nr:hypothetical protein NPIL_12421 [Nephila pilipes]